MIPRAVRVAFPLASLAICYWSAVVSPPRTALASRSLPISSGLVQARELSSRADEAFKRGRFAEAAVALEALEARTPDSVVVLNLLAQSYEKLDRWTDAADRWEHYLSVSPTPEEACPGLPRAYEAQGKPDEAFKAYERCHQLMPADADLALFLAQAQIRRGDFAAARRVITPALAANDRYVDLHVVMAVLDRQDGHRDAALRQCERALELEPGNADAAAIRDSLRSGR